MATSCAAVSSNMMIFKECFDGTGSRALELHSLLDGRSRVALKGENAVLGESADVLDKAVMERLNNFDVVLFDGDNYRENKWTKYIKMYLETNHNGTVVATKLDKEKGKFLSSWSSDAQLDESQLRRLYLVTPSKRELEAAKTLEEYTACPLVHAVCNPKYVYLGREFLKATKPEVVLAIGGGRVARAEAELSMVNDHGPDAPKWIILNPPEGTSLLKQWLVDRAQIPEDGHPVTKLSVQGNFTMELISGEESQELKAQQCSDLANLFNPSSPVSGYYLQDAHQSGVWARIQAKFQRMCCCKGSSQEDARKRQDVLRYFWKNKDQARSMLALVEGHSTGGTGCSTGMVGGAEAVKLSQVSRLLRSAVEFERIDAAYCMLED